MQRRDYRDDRDVGNDRDVRSDRDVRPRRRPERPVLSAIEAAKAGLQLVADATGREPEGIVSLEPADGGWVVGVEVVEDRRIPSSTDILGLYEATIDGNGDLMAYSRKGRYGRGRTDTGGGV